MVASDLCPGNLASHFCFSLRVDHIRTYRQQLARSKDVLRKIAPGGSLRAELKRAEITYEGLVRRLAEMDIGD